MAYVYMRRGQHSLVVFLVVGVWYRREHRSGTHRRPVGGMETLYKRVWAEGNQGVHCTERASSAGPDGPSRDEYRGLRDVSGGSPRGTHAPTKL